MRTMPFVLMIAALVMNSCVPGPNSRAHPQNPTLASYPTLNAPATSRPGQRPDGSVLLPNQWALHPAGRQVELGDFPVNMAVHPGGRFAAILHEGFSQHEIVLVDIATSQVAERTPIKEAFYGLEFAADGKKLFCSGAGEEVIHEFDFANGILTNHHRIRLHPAGLTCVPAGLAVDREGRRAFAANVWGHRITEVQLGPDPSVSDIPLGKTTNGANATVLAASSDFDTAAAEKRAQAALYGTSPEDTFPYTCRLDERRHRLYVSLWAQAAIAVIDLKARKVVERWQTEEHPCEMALTRSGQYLFVANASRNTVTVLDTRSGKPLETICTALYPQAPPGSTPNSLALSPNERTLFVANADNNMVAVFDVGRLGKARSLGFIPAGWYPTSVRLTPDGKKLLIANGKGIVPRANPLGPQPGLVTSTNRTEQFIASLLRGTLSIIDLAQGKAFESQMAGYTSQAYQCSPLRPDASVVAGIPAANPVPSKPGAASPIKYCLYVIKENRTYDQVLGDMPEGNGDPKLCLFPEGVTPNMHALARDFVLLDNFYVDGEVSADGHEWTMAAYATDFVEKMWPLDYGHNQSGKFPYPSEGNFPVAIPAGGYLWDRAREAGVSYRSYGEFVTPGQKATDPGRSRVRALDGHFDLWYRGFDLGYSDVKRTERFISELKRFESEGEMPRLQIIRLPNDHTHGSTVGMLTPTAYVGDNDLGLGMLIEAVSHSKFWPQTAVFVVEDDAQNGPDHVDAHRTTAFVLSPYAKRGAVDSTMYSTTSMLRTIELILGLKPMSQFDAAARPMFNSFQPEPNLAPYQARAASVNLEERNGKHAWGGEIRMNFAREDAADDLLLNEVVWRSVRGPDSPMPAPVRAAFVLGHGDRDGDD